MTVDTAELRRLLEAATPGPWTWLPDDGDENRKGWCRFGGEGALDESGYAIERDAELAVAVVNALPVLLDPLDTYRETLTKIRDFQLPGAGGNQPFYDSARSLARAALDTEQT